MPLSKNERESILDRDGFTSQMRHYSEERGFHIKQGVHEYKLQVHHIYPQRYAHAVLGLLATEVDTPYNLITLFEEEHNGRLPTGELVNPDRSFVVHPDMIKTFTEHRRGNKNAFAEMFAMRDALLDRGEPYWNTDHDEEMLESARRLTDAALANGWTFPSVKRRA